jgi:hypothetical protein
MRAKSVSPSPKSVGKATNSAQPDTGHDALIGFQYDRPDAVSAHLVGAWLLAGVGNPKIAGRKSSTRKRTGQVLPLDKRSGSRDVISQTLTSGIGGFLRNRDPARGLREFRKRKGPVQRAVHKRCK